MIMNSDSDNELPDRPRICIIGAGIAGLSTAEVLTHRYTGFDVTIVADDLSDRIVSYVAAGVFFPDRQLIHDESTNLRWAQQTYDHLKSLADLNQPQLTGVQTIRGYFLYSYDSAKSRHPDQPDKHDGWFDSAMHKITGHSFKLNQADLQQLFPHADFVRGHRYETVIADPSRYLPFLRNRFEMHGKLIQRCISFQSERDWQFLRSNFDLIVVCAGLGAGRLMQDTLLTPIRGQTLSVLCPEVRSFYKFNRFYILPEADGRLVLGGIKQYSCDDPRICSDDEQAIWSAATSLLPQIDQSPVMRRSVGLRPFRPHLRVDLDQLSRPKMVDNGHEQNDDESALPVVNNYGHGGSGYSYGYASACHAARLVFDKCRQLGFTVHVAH